MREWNSIDKIMRGDLALIMSESVHLHLHAECSLLNSTNYGPQ